MCALLIHPNSPVLLWWLWGGVYLFFLYLQVEAYPNVAISRAVKMQEFREPRLCHPALK
jgi:hypothetical protein